MREEIKNTIRVASIYMATIIGAGFASGQEIIQFFSTYNRGGFYGIVLAGLLFALLGCLVLEQVYHRRIRNYSEFIRPILGVKLGRLAEGIGAVFMFCLFCIMLAGAGNILKEKLGIPYLLSVLLMSLLCMVFIFTSIRGIVVLSTAVTPVLITGIILAGLYIILSRELPAFYSFEFLHDLKDNWFTSAVLYVGYNSILSIVMLTGMLPYLKSGRTARLGGFIGGLLLCVVAFILNIALTLNYSRASEAQLPVLHLLNRYNVLIAAGYSLLLWLAMLVSAVNAGYCFVDRVAGGRTKLRIPVTLAICAVAVPLSQIGFSRLISWIYPLFGYFGVAIAAVVIWHGFRRNAGLRRK